MEKTRKYPVGIQTFSRIRKDGYLYVDKTDLMWQMTKESPFVFLSRPRRFGKSLLTTTLDSYFRGQRELFEGLKIMELEKHWEQFPILHIDMSMAKNRETPEELSRVLCLNLEPLIDIYGRKESEVSPGDILRGLIRRAFERTSKQVVVLIDEYDAPMLDVLHEKERLPEFRRVMQEFYQPLKACEAMIRFCFITGITKFSQLSIFSTLNNIKNISMLPQFSAICGITETELDKDLAEDIRLMAASMGLTEEETHEKLKLQYDGYMFSESSEEIYNPYSLMNAFSDHRLSNYWFESGTPSFLIRQMQYFHTDVTAMDHIEAAASDFDQPTENMEDALPLLYQSGYLTIKKYDRLSDTYILAIPNKEVRTGLVSGLIPAYTGLKRNDTQGFALRFWRTLFHNDIDGAMKEMKAFLAGIPYVEGFQKKLEEVKNYEGFYEYTFWLIFNMFNVYAQTQVKCQGGRIDFVMQMPACTYVFELKVNGTAQQAMDQINSKGYYLPYDSTDRRVVKVGVQFDRNTMTIGEYIIE